MITKEVRDKYTPTIGIECHVQLKTKTKLFAAVGNDAREAPPNTLVSHICFGLPGALPVLNKEAVRLASRAAFALGSEPAHFSKFDRKHYFYPDLPKGYQISQYDQPIITGGYVDVPLIDAETKETRSFRVGIVRAHLEEDAGKSTHPTGKDYSLVDLNRAGTPLLEIVSQPDMHSPTEAKAYVRELYLRMKYAGVSDANLYYGNMRFDVNVSVSGDPNKLGIRTETKNLNSFRSVEKTVEYEINRQIEVLEKGGEVIQETRGWDDAKQRTFAQRSKEEAHDYRYMPDPDLPPVVLDQAYISAIKAAMPELPDAYREIFSKLGLDRIVIEDIIAVPDIARTVNEVYGAGGENHARRVAFWLLRPQSEENEGADTKVDVAIQNWLDLSQMVEDGLLSSTAAKQVLDDMLITKNRPKVIAEAKNLLQVSDEGEIAKAVAQVLAENEKAANDVKNGEMKAIGFLVGQVMKASEGKANPSLAQALIRKQLGI